MDPNNIYTRLESHKLTLSMDIDSELVDDAKVVYDHARDELENALAQTEEGTKVHNLLFKALSDMPKDPKTTDEIIDNYNQALKDLGPLS